MNSKIRPADSTGDILPVLSLSDLLSGADAVAVLVKGRLELAAGEWWEDSRAGCEITDLLQEARMTGSDLQALASYLSSYIRETPGVREITGSEYSAEGRVFSFSCTVLTDGGTAEIRFAVPA